MNALGGEISPVDVIPMKLLSKPVVKDALLKLAITHPQIRFSAKELSKAFGVITKTVLSNYKVMDQATITGMISAGLHRLHLRCFILSTVV